MHDVDLIGFRAVSAVIQQSGLSKFLILRAGDSLNATPIYESNASKTPKEASANFEKWAETVLSANPSNKCVYQIAVYNKQEDDARSRGDKIKFNFILSQPEMSISSPPQPVPSYPISDAMDIESRINQAVLTALQQKENEDLKARLGELEERLNEFEEEEPKPDFMQLATAILSGLANKQAFSNNQNEARLAGVEDRKELLNNAVKRLLAIDEKLPEHLDKLADIAENNPQKFKFLLSALEEM